MGAGHAPALAGVGESFDLAQAEAVVDEADMRRPGPLVEVGSPIDDALAEVLRWDFLTLQGFSGFRLGMTLIAELPVIPVLVKQAVEIEEAFGVAVWSVGICDDRVAANRAAMQVAVTALRRVL